MKSFTWNSRTYGRVSSKDARLTAKGWLFGVVYAAIFSALPWHHWYEAIYKRPYEDRSVYDIQLRMGYISTDVIFDNVTSIFSNELSWKLILSFLYQNLGLAPDAIFFIISFLTILSFSLIIIRHSGPIWVLMLINPLVVDFAFSQLRLALAMSLTLIIYSVSRIKLAQLVAWMVAFATIHTSMVLFVFMATVSRLCAISKRANSYAVIIPIVASGLCVSILIGPLRESVLGYAGDRRAVFYYSDVSSSIAYLSFWLVLLMVLVYRWKTVKNRSEVAFAIAILSVVAFNVFFEGYSSRFISAAFPFLIVSINSLRGIYRIVTTICFVLFSLFQWGYWLRVF